MPQVCSQCQRVNPPEAAYCYHDGVLLAGHAADDSAVRKGARPFPNPFVFPSGVACRNFDQLAMACQQNWSQAVDLLKQGYLASFLGGISVRTCPGKPANIPEGGANGILRARRA